MTDYDLHEKAAAIVIDAGGKLVGRTRLQKVAYLSQLAGFSHDFAFEYRHYGPYSEDLAQAMEIATGLRLVQEKEKPTGWGGWFSVYQTGESEKNMSSDESRSGFISTAAEISAIELELAATAAFLYAEEKVGQGDGGDPWEETRCRKPEKAGEGRLNKAKGAYKKLSALSTPTPLPPIA